MMESESFSKHSSKLARFEFENFTKHFREQLLQILQIRRSENLLK